MTSRLTRFLLLACFAFWASGAALYAHERLEHAGAGGADEALFDGAGGAAPTDSARPVKPVPGPGHPDHDHCPVCQLLAHLKADRPAPPVAVPVHQPVVAIVTAIERRPPVAAPHPFTPIRGPPVGRTTPC